MAGRNGETEGGVGQAARSEAFVDTIMSLLCACVQMFASSEGAVFYFFAGVYTGVVLLFRVV